jgi:hypothetical protein
VKIFPGSEAQHNIQEELMLSEDVPSSTEHNQQEKRIIQIKKFVILRPKFSPLQLNKKFLF